MVAAVKNIYEGGVWFNNLVINISVASENNEKFKNCYPIMFVWTSIIPCIMLEGNFDLFQKSYMI